MKKRILSLVMAILMVMILATLFTGCSSTDYVATVKAMQPYRSVGDSSTYGTVISRYITSSTWSQEVHPQDYAYVVVSGKLDKSNVDVTLTFLVSADRTTKTAMAKPYSMSFGGKTYDMESTQTIVANMFAANDAGFDSFTDYSNSLSGS